MIFQWNAGNGRHIAKHGVTEAEAQEVADHARPPFPRAIEDDKHLVWGRTESGRYLQVIYVFLADEDVNFQSLPQLDRLRFEDGQPEVAFIIHAMELTAGQKRQYRRLVR